MARVYLKGLPKLKAKLQKLAKDASPTMRKALARAASMVVIEIKSRAEWARVRKSVGWTFGTPPKYSQTLGVMGEGELRATIYVGGKSQRISHWLEHGTRPHFNKGMFEGSIHPGTVAQPFFFPGWRSKRTQVRKMIREAMQKSIRGIAKS